MRNYTPKTMDAFDWITCRRFGIFCGTAEFMAFSFATKALGIVTAAAVGGTIGILSAFLIPILLRKCLRTEWDKAIAGLGKYAVSLPDGLEPQLSLPVYYWKSSTVFVPGALFLSQDRAVFAPRRSHVSLCPAPLSIPVDRSSKIQLARPDLNLAQRLLFPGIPPVMRVLSGSQRFDFSVPSAEEAVPQACETVFGNEHRDAA